ncbi:MAG TPA: S41 family peptidase [Pirellulales bacterium]|jgi:carboxyl-terminal processing protease|nr:S41 family peptidase [Pirellulales bacterium]
MSARTFLVGLVVSTGLFWATAATPQADEPPTTDKAKPVEKAKPATGAKSPAKKGDQAPDETAKAAAEKEKADRARRAADDEYFELYKVFADTMYQVEQNYVKDVDRRELMEAAIRGVLDKLDPYSNYISPDEISRFKTSVESQFGGIGIQITMDGGRLKILSPLVGSPAYRAGLQAGDTIDEINGKSTAGLGIDDAVKLLKGEAGSDVSLSVRHRSGGKETVHLEREVIHLDTVLGDLRKDDDRWDFMLDHERKIGYIRITAFSRETPHDVEAALKQLDKEHVRALIIDLRFNPGGLLKSATDIADLFVAEGLIVKTVGRNTSPREVHAHKAGTYEGYPIAILVNRYSASASEIVSACLQDHHRAVVIGERTWGKGSVQNVIDLEDGKSALKLTTASYWRPSGKNIHRFPDAKEADEWGVSPDKGYEMKLTDNETSDLVRYRRDRDVLQVNHFKKPVKTDELAVSETSVEGGTVSKPKATQGANDMPAVESKSPAEPKAPVTKPQAKTPDADDQGEAKKERVAFVDRQLQKAVEYVTTEMAKKSP